MPSPQSPNSKSATRPGASAPNGKTLEYALDRYATKQDANAGVDPSQKPEDRPDTPHPDLSHFEWERTMCIDLDTSVRVMQQKAVEYLPKHGAEDEDMFKKRAEFTEVFDAFPSTLDKVAGLVFQKSSQLSDLVPDVIHRQFASLTPDGKHGDVLLHDSFRRGLRSGFRGLWVDMQTVPENVAGQRINYKQERLRNLRPFWHDIGEDQIVNWRLGVRAGVMYFTMLILKETRSTEVGLFGTAYETQYRVYRHDLSNVDANGNTAPGAITHQIWRLKTVEGGKKRMMPDGEPLPIIGPKRIPFRPYQLGEACGPVVAKPAMLGLAYLNLAHWRVASDRRWLMHLCCVPVPWAKDLKTPPQKNAGQAPPIIFGPNVLVELGMNGAFGWAEPTGSAFQPTKDELDELKNQMASIGLAYLQRDKRQAETEDSKRMDKAPQHASIAWASRQFEDAVEDCIQFHADFLGIELPEKKDKKSRYFSLNRDYEKTTMSLEMLTFLSDMEAKQQLTLETLWAAMEDVEGLLPKTFEAKKERARLALVRPGTDDDDDSPYADDPPQPDSKAA